MKLLRRFGEFLNKYVAETTAIIVVLILILLLFEFFFEVTGTKFLELLPSVAALLSVVLLFLALLQTVKANRFRSEEVPYKFYLKILKGFKKSGNIKHNLEDIHSSKQFNPPLSTNTFTILNGRALVITILTGTVDVVGIVPNSVSQAFRFLNRYILFYEVSRDYLLRMKAESLTSRYEADLLKRFSQLFGDFMIVGSKLKDIPTPNMDGKKGLSPYQKSLLITRIQDVYNKVNPILPPL